MDIPEHAVRPVIQLLPEKRHNIEKGLPGLGTDRAFNGKQDLCLWVGLGQALFELPLDLQREQSRTCRIAVAMDRQNASLD
jgi:hypothetical protein